jgi:anaerobic selenocysteine-containing dehydrogenase
MNQDTRTPESATSTDEGYKRRDFLKITSTVAAGTGLATVGMSFAPKEAQAHAYAPYYTDDQLTTVVTSCAHNCGSRHVLVAHKKGDVIVRLSTDNGSYQEGGSLRQGHRTGAAAARLPAWPLLSLAHLLA